MTGGGLLVNQISAVDTVSARTAWEFDGAIEVHPEYAGRSLAELESGIRDLSDDMRLDRLKCGWQAMAWLAQSGAVKRSERIAALEILADETGNKRSDLREWFYVARHFPPDEAARYIDKPWTWLLNVVTGTSDAGAPGTPQRREAVAVGAEKAADMTARDARATLDAERQSNGRGSFLEVDDEPLPHPALGEIPPHEAPDLVEQFTSGLEKRLTRENPGLWSDAAVIVRMFLCERVAQGWRLEAPR